jgi:hypothetical protein
MKKYFFIEHNKDFNEGYTLFRKNENKIIKSKIGWIFSGVKIE